MGSLPQNASELRVLLDQINRMDPTIFHADPAEAKEAAYAAQKLVMRAQAPLDVTTMLGWQEPSRVSAVKIAIDAGWFSVISRRGGAATVSDIAAATDADPRLVDRVMRVLASFGLLDELGVGMFGATAFSEYVQTPTGASGIEYWFDIGTHSFLTLPEYLAKTKYQDVRGAENWKIAKNTDLGIWDWLVAHPEALKSLDNHMASMTPDFGGWVEVYPVERILEAVDLGGPLLVDVGGGMGQDAERFLQKAARPFASGRIIVQDQEAVIAKADPDPSITMRAHDFFQAQPVQGARAYLLHNILHDHTDSDCIRILQGIVPAMTKGHSRLLIAESIIPDQGAAPFAMAMDFLMLATMGGAQRTARQWHDLLGQVGQTIVKVWPPGRYTESVVEAERLG